MKKNVTTNAYPSVKKALWASLAAAFTFSSALAAAPLDLATVPLIVTEGAPPNIMILFDTSGSMHHITAGSPYDSAVGSYTNCPAARLINPWAPLVSTDNGDGVRAHQAAGLGWGFEGDYPVLRVYKREYNEVDGETESTLMVDREYFVTTNTSGASTLTLDGYTADKGCFDGATSPNPLDPTDTIPNTLYGMDLSTTGRGSGAQYGGHYLNFYFDTGRADVTWDSSITRNPTQFSRLAVGKDVITNFVNNRVDGTINLGVTNFNDIGGNSHDGGRIQEIVSTLDLNKKNAVISTVDGFSANTWTPLAETLIEIGQYFTGTAGGEDLLVHPDPGGITGGVPTSVSDVFKRSAKFDSGINIADRGSPITEDAFCAKNFIIAMTDGEPTQDRTNIGDTFDNYDGDCATDCKSHDRKESGGYSYGNRGSDYMDDVVQGLYEMDLRPDIDDRFTGDEVQHNIQTYLIGFADPSIKNNPLFIDTAAQGSDPVPNNDPNIAPVPRTPFFPSSAEELDQTFEDIINNIFASTGSFGSVSFNSGQFNAGSAIFQARFTTRPWGGSLLAFNLDDSTGVIDPTPVWNAGAVLDGRVNPATTRNVIAFDPSPSTPGEDGVVVSVANWDALPSEMKLDLYEGPDLNGNNNTADTDEAKQLLSYLLGDGSLEGGESTNYRKRRVDTSTVYNRLGDIVNSTPVYVGDPELAWPENSENAFFGGIGPGESYSTFKSRYTGRTPTVYVGANDGMLHGFNAQLATVNAGNEVIAYIPGLVYSDAAGQGLHYLAERTYGHQFYVDLSPTVSDVYIDPDGSSGSSDPLAKEWITILVGGLRAGGRGLFALDVTDPDSYGTTSAKDTVLWEFTDPDLGYVYSQPTIAMMPNGKWAVIVGNGYNSTGSGNAMLFIIYIEEGTDGTWSAGDVKKIDTGVNTFDSGAGGDIPNGLSTPRAVDLNGDKVVDRIYAGDLEGNMWVFELGDPNDVTNNDPADDANWVVGHGGNPLFIACSSEPCFAADRQPITAAPILARNPSANTAGNEPNVLVLFGTGKFIENTDPTSITVNSYYSVWDAGISTVSLTRADLEPRVLTNVVLGSDPTVDPVRRVTGLDFVYGVKQGWYMDLPEDGERAVAGSQIRRDIVFFNTVIPNDVLCSTGGTGWLMSLDFDTGLAPTTFAVFDANGDGTIDANDQGFVGEFFGSSLPAESGFLGDQQYTPGSDGEIQSREVDSGAGDREGRLTWEEARRQ